MTTELEWRRQWIPDLRASPWHPLEIEGRPFLVKWFFTESSYQIILTDFSSFWYEELSGDSLTDRVKKLNPGLEVSLMQILEHIQCALEKTLRDAELNISMDPIRDGIRHEKVLTIVSRLVGMPFIWKFFCSLEDSKVKEQEISEDGGMKCFSFHTAVVVDFSWICIVQSSNHMIIPLMVMVSELKRRQKELVKIIQNKDREIEDYTSQGLVPVRKNLKTEPFVETAFEMAMMTSREFVYELKNCRTNTFNASGQDLYRQVMAINAWIERSPDELDEESDSLALNCSMEGTRSPPALASGGCSQMPAPITGSKSSKIFSFKSPKKGSSKSPKSPVLNSAEDSELLQRQAGESELQHEETMKKKSKKKKALIFRF